MSGLARTKAPLTHDRLKQLLDYDPATGIFTRRIKTSNHCNPHGVAGSKDTLGYLRLSLDGCVVLAHRAAWFYVHGVWPRDIIDHINGVKDDNRLSNLREATRQQNGFNRGKNSNNKSGFKGVRQRESGRWEAYITVKRKRITIGLYDRPQEASAAYETAAKLHFGEFSHIARECS